MTATGVHASIEAVWRMESAQIIAALTRIVRDLGVAEELAQDALVAALQQWPRDGVPAQPGAWLMATAKHRALDRLRRGKLLKRKHALLQHEAEAEQALAQPAAEAALDDAIGDDLLRLTFMACHPLLSNEARVALALKVLAGLSTAEIARAFLVPEATIAQRIVRAKRTLETAGVAFELPDAQALGLRLASVLEVIYLVFSEGHAATAGAQWLRTDLCDEALRLGRILVQLAPREPEAHGLLALMELQASRLRARVDGAGRPVLLAQQNRAHWDPLLIRRGLAALARAEQLGGAFGPYALQAAIAACHARALSVEDTDWARIVALYDLLLSRIDTPVVRLNRAVAVGMAYGAEAGLALVETLVDASALAQSPLLPAVRGDLLARLERKAEASAEFRRAAALTRNEAERAHWLERAADSE